MDVLSALARAKPAGPPPTITTSLSCGTAVAIARKRVRRKDLTTFLPLVLARSMMRRGVTHRRMEGTARPRPVSVQRYMGVYSSESAETNIWPCQAN